MTDGDYLTGPANKKDFDEVAHRQQTVQQSQQADLLAAHSHQVNQCLMTTLDRQQTTIDELCRIVKMLVVKQRAEGE